VVIPAALAVAEHVGASGQQLLDAVVVGYEVMLRISYAVSPYLIAQGHHPPVAVGPFGVAAAAARLLDLEVGRAALAEIAGRCRGTPRIANRLLRRVRDYALVHGGSGIEAVNAALELYDVDELGLDRLDRAVLEAILTRFDGGPVGLGTLAVSVGEEAETIESVVEPFLVRIGMLTRTPRGRVASKRAWKHLGLSRDPGALFGDDL